ncbi:hypothetical protein FOQG_16991 [Fusarium oxysporum f. sp. raphani 54005]|uniref:Uncharacterized protein n=2 Tax=Fusarium oxysporum TaxID=5507 RepID=X0BIP3_FUSOX|nr:hypothetical protein FOMG_17174 [Fusarium oxysporum f. sp. melonis 26406]EXK78334.1 hypothetical protein FOQG_16991 [Fusarium oxysporum f. sp. raphani 54005]
MDREREAALQYLRSKIRRLEEDETDPMFRIFNFTFAFGGSRKAQTVLRTWYEPGMKYSMRFLTSRVCTFETKVDENEV